MKELHELLARNLKTLRAYRNLTQDGLADAAGITKNYVAEIETGRKYPSPEVHLRLARALGVRPYQLLMESGPPADPAVIGGLRDQLVREVIDVIDRNVPPGR